MVITEMAAALSKGDLVYQIAEQQDYREFNELFDRLRVSMLAAIRRLKSQKRKKAGLTRGDCYHGR